MTLSDTFNDIVSELEDLKAEVETLEQAVQTAIETLREISTTCSEAIASVDADEDSLKDILGDLEDAADGTATKLEDL